jgi:type I restriction enzyme R subunit
MSALNENVLEQACLEWLAELGWQVAHGPDLSPGGSFCEREDYRQVIFAGRLRSALERINRDMPPGAIEEALKKITTPKSPELLINNRQFHRYLTDGVDVEIAADSLGERRHRKVWLIDIEDLENNDWLAVNQFTVVEEKRNRRTDILLFLNGMPLAILELKNPAAESADTRSAFNQIQTYKRNIPSLFATNEFVGISDGFQAKVGMLTSGWDRFMPWRTVDGTEVLPKGAPELEVLVRGLFQKKRFVDYILNFVVFEDNGADIIKKGAAYHQYWAVNRALEATLSACGIDADPGVLVGINRKDDEPSLLAEEPKAVYGKGSSHFGQKRIGVVWHTQGSGKSLSMAFFAGKVVKHPGMENPTLVIITDRNDLDDQLFGTFAGCSQLLRQTPIQAESRTHIRQILKVASGGIIFTTIQKFMPDEKGDSFPLLSNRRNIVVIADEAHRSQYDFIDGFARHLHDALPNASFIGFTGTPIERDDRSTPAVFGDYIDKYDILRAVEDGATVPIYYESRLARIELTEDSKEFIDPEFNSITEGEEESGKERLKTKWAALEAMIGADTRLALIAADLVFHFSARLEVLEGKAMVVCMSRRICVDLYEAIRKLRPEWHSDDDASGELKIVMSGSASDEPAWQPHIRTKNAREALAKRFKNPEDSLKIVIVRDMWLTGFDCPSMHTMYVDKPMSGHNLMQAIARVNRVFRDKPGGLVVDYLGLAESLKRALADYSESGGRGDATIDQEEAVKVFLEKFGIVRSILHGFNLELIIASKGSERIKHATLALEYLLGLEDGKPRYLTAVSAMSKAFALAVPHSKAIALRDEVGVCQEIRAALLKVSSNEGTRSPSEMDAAIKQLVSKAVSSTEVVDIFKAAGLEKPDISILSDDFLEEVRQLPQRNLALELLKKLINDEIKTRAGKNIVQSRAFSEMLERSIRKYQNRAIAAAEVIHELIELAKQIRESQNRGAKLKLNDDEVAFYDALAENGSAVQVMGDDKLKFLSQELVLRVRQSVSIDWTLRENARAQIRVLVKRILRQFGYPPDMEKKATELVLEQAEHLCKGWSLV